MASISDTTTTAAYTPVWMGDFGTRDHLLAAGAKVDYTQFIREDGTRVTLTAPAIQGATAIAFAAITNPIPSGTVLDFGGAKFARTTAAAAAGATGVAVAALPTALAGNEVATYNGTGRVLVPSGTYVGRTFAEMAAGTPYGPAAVADDEKFLIAYDVTDASVNAYITLVRHGALVKETKLPNWTTMGAPLQTDIRANYQCIRGAD